MQAYAVIETGGKQYRVQTGDVLEIERLPGVEAGKKLALAPVLARHDGKNLQIGTPTLPDAQVLADVIAQTRGPKIVAFKKKRRKGYHRKVGHRQNLIQVKIQSIA